MLSHQYNVCSFHLAVASFAAGFPSNYNIDLRIRQQPAYLVSAVAYYEHLPVASLTLASSKPVRIFFYSNNLISFRQEKVCDTILVLRFHDVHNADNDLFVENCKFVKEVAKRIDDLISSAFVQCWLKIVTTMKFLGMLQGDKWKGLVF